MDTLVGKLSLRSVDTTGVGLSETEHDEQGMEHKSFYNFL